jgi:predicted dehydrogenase
VKKLNFILIGCGRIGARHAEHIGRFGTLAAVCDTDLDRAKELSALHGGEVFTSMEALFSQKHYADVVAVCSPNGLHAEHSIAALRAGYHVLCEKPMALSVYDCGEMIKEAEKANRRLFIVKQNRYNPPVVAVKKLIEDGRLGKIYSAQLNCYWNRNPDYYRNTWKGTRDMDGGILFTQFSHFIDLLYWLIGDVKSVHAIVDNLSGRSDIEFEDSAVAVCRFYNGAIGSLHFTINAHHKNMEGSLTLFGEKGTVKIGGQYLNELEYQSIDGDLIADLPPGAPPNNYGQYQGSMSNHDKVYQNVSDVLTADGVIGTNGFEGLKTVEIIDKIYDACRH